MSGFSLDVVLASNSELLIVYVDSRLHSDHYPYFALLNFSVCSSESATNLTNKYSLSAFSSTHFTIRLSTGFNKLMALMICSCSEMYIEEYSSVLQQTLMDALNMPCKNETTRQLQFPYFYSSHAVHLIKKFRIAENVTTAMVASKGYDKKLVFLLNETKQFFWKISPLTPLVPASSFCVFCRQIACQNKRTATI